MVEYILGKDAIPVQLWVGAPFEVNVLSKVVRVMSAGVLVLNRGFNAVQVAHWQEAFTKLVSGAAVAVDEDLVTHTFTDWVELSKVMEDHPGGFVRTVNFRVAIPEAIKLVNYDKLPPHRVAFNKLNIYSHHKNRCCYCGKRFSTKELNLDHVIPRSKGGLSNWENIVTACIPCNARKADKTPEQAGMKLLVVPSKPKWRSPSATIALSLPIRTSVTWQKLIDQVYWHTEIDES